MKQDFYELLGVARDAGTEDIKTAYRKLAMAHHPDRNPGNKESEEHFKRINEAYDVLRDPQKRSVYDRYGAGGPGGAGAEAQGFDFGNIGGIFEEVFSEFVGARAGGRGGAGPARGSDLRYDMEISLDEAFSGIEREIRIASAAACDSCKGSGSKPGTQPQTCPTCRGHGRVRVQRGFFTLEQACHACQGVGRIIKDPCPSCKGAGRKRVERQLSIRIPPGVEDGTRIRLTGEGEAGPNGTPSGDLYVVLGIRAHPFFQREGASIYCRAPIPMTIAALGGQIEVPTIDGSRIMLDIPVGTQTGQQFRLRAKGMSVLHSESRGEMYVQSIVETPTNLTRREEEILREFARERGEREHEDTEGGFLSRIKEFWKDISE
ncbi:MAG: molecular chaperone DnaJ [Alphaproteobacteria bacterium]|nr:MAG: molecular chaperone DnaJ [Alphaproteobacteria bacterium]